MKKKYVQPTMEVVSIAPLQMLAGSSLGMHDYHQSMSYFDDNDWYDENDWAITKNPLFG